MAADLSLRRARDDDADSIVAVYLAARREAAMPPGIHPDHEVRAWLASRLGADEVWVAETPVTGETPETPETPSGRLAAYARMTETWLDDLYVAPDHARQGVGSALLDLVKSRRPDGFCLWVFEMNVPARAFYARHGLVELERTDGEGNEERAPDVRMAWPGQDPLAFFRGLIDDVDDQLGDLLARRVALTREVQQLKADGGSRRRDPERERQIAARLAARAPELGEERLARIVQAIVTQSLDATPGRPGGE
jgi:chorismate mutase/GNAT superfamily N-acetyltransferase